MKNEYHIPRTLCISSRKDPAGTLIHEELCVLLKEEQRLLPYVTHWRAEERLIYLDGPSLPHDADRIVFLSRHASERPRPVLTVHVTGNYGAAEYGGDPGCLTAAATSLMHSMINSLVRHAPAGYEVMYEATHHGPTSIPIPSCFVELGSTEKEWHDRDAARAIARAVIDSLTADDSHVIPLAGFGGTHYAQRQTEIAKLTRGGFGHIMPTRDLPHLTAPLFREIITKSGAVAIYIDAKSLSGKEERMITHLANQYGIAIMSQGELMQLHHLSFAQYMEIKALAASLIPGSSVVLHNLAMMNNPAVCSVPAELVDEVIKEDLERFISALEPLPVAHLTGRGKACHSLFLTDCQFVTEISDQLIHLCITLLQDRFTCSFEGDCLIIKKKRFDPDKAKNFGIPPGPQYRDLMTGMSVCAGGLVISPDMVMTETEKRIKIPQRQDR
jgi:D-aminoacyl-tRNA deacylase